MSLIYKLTLKKEGLIMLISKLKEMIGANNNPKKSQLIKLIKRRDIPNENIDMLIKMIEVWEPPKC